MTMEDLQAKMMRWSIACPKAAEKVLKQAAYLVQNSAQHDFMGSRALDPSHERLYVQTGRLRRSITQKVTASPGEYCARVGTNVEYAAIHEFGGSIRRRFGGLAGLRAQALTGTDLGGVTNMPARPYLRPALAKQHPRIFKMLEEAAFSSYA